MKIYHGANFNRLDKILSNGLSPRGKRQSVWSDAPSHPGMVYLSTAYPFYFSRAAQSKKNFHKGLVFEVDMDKLNESMLFPDEDFIWHVLKIQNPDITIKEIREDLWRYHSSWKLSLENLGNVAYLGKININCLTRYCIVDFDKQKELGWSVLDPTISIMNYRFKGQFYKDLVSWFFGDIDELPQIKELKGWGDAMKVHQDKINFWTKVNKNRDGIKVVTII